MDVLAEPAFGTRPHAVHAVRDRLGDVLQNQNVILPWQDFEVRNVKKAEGKNEAALILRHRLVGIGHRKLRWFVSSARGRGRSTTWKTSMTACACPRWRRAAPISGELRRSCGR